MKLDFKSLKKTVRVFTSKNAHKILTGLGIAGLISTTVLTANSTVKAVRKIDEAEMEYGELTKKEKAKLVWKCYIPPASSLLFTSLCVCGSCKVSSDKIEKLGGALALKTVELTNTKSALKEVLTPKKEAEVREKIAQKDLESKPATTIITSSKPGSVLCKDQVTGLYFYSDVETIRKAVNTINERLTTEMYIPVKELYCELGIDPGALATCDVADTIGWDVNAQGFLHIDFDTLLVPEGMPMQNEVCLVISYDWVTDFHKY